MGRLRHADTYGRDERGIAYGTRVLGRRRPRSSRRSHARPGRAGKPPAGRRGPGDRTPGDREVCVMQSAATVLGVLRERAGAACRARNCTGRCSTRSCICWPTGVSMPTKARRRPGPRRKPWTACRWPRSAALLMRCATSATDSGLFAGCTSLRRTGKRDRWACQPGRISSPVKWCACCLRRTTSRCSPAVPMGFVPAGAATPRCARWPIPGPGQPGLSKETSPTASGLSTMM